ncbi:cytochrome c family protein [Parvularcula maris]|uniref:Cytochrome c family protein n=1 Tax=Parvularcula maris TaxID=2965077 RepID=A0A9X2LBL9_9PROT|nr:cytochrome c family protein [Parvularcula maris]MCQ8186489.1 cytochrome c family protein [Parvularcula maris]
MSTQGQGLRELLRAEMSWRNAAMGLLTVTAVLAVLKAVLPVSAEAMALLGLGHLLTAAPLAVFGSLYTFHHFRRTAGIKRWGLSASGIASALLLGLLISTGIALAVLGPATSRAGIAAAHMVMGLSVVGLVVLHVVLAARREGAAPRFASYRRVGLAGLLLAAVLVGGGSVLDLTDPRKSPAAPQTADYGQSYGPHPFKPSQTETSTGGFVHPDYIATSVECGACHQAIFEQWRESMHGQAAADPTYVKNITFLVENKGMEAARYCEGCHAPVALLTGELSEGGDHGGTAGTPAFHEGVGCLSCHGTKDMVHLKGVGSYMLDADDGMAPLPVPGGKTIRRAMILADIESHKEAMNQPVLSSPALCAGCHEQFMDRDMNDWGWVKMQADYSSWLESPFSGQHDHRFAVDQAMPCQSCHMPLVRAEDPSANADGMVMSHRFPGANTAIPHVLGFEEQERIVREFLQAGRMRVSIDPVEQRSAAEETTFVDPRLRRGSDAPALVYNGEKVELQISVANIGVGHAFPGGTTDLNEAWLAVTVRDGSGRLVAETGAIDGEGYVDEEATFYKSVPIDREGREVWRHDLFNMVGEAYRRTIPAGGADVVSFAFDVPHWAKGPLTVTASLNYRKLNKRYSSWSLGSEVALPVTEVARDVQTLSVKSRPAVFAGGNQDKEALD